MRKMKDSGIAWIGKIPEGWGKDRFKYSGEFAKGKIPNKLNSEKKGVPYIGASEINSYEFKNYTEDSSVVFCTQNDILFLWDGANAGNVATGFKGAVSSTIVKYSLYNAKTVQRYVYYLIKYAENYFKDKVNGTTIPHMNFQYIDDIPLLLPSLSTQRKIADFLDKKCAEIDKLIELQESMIEKLKEYKQSVITQAVTKGLDLDVPMKDSGIEWIGKISQRFVLRRLKEIVRILDEYRKPITSDLRNQNAEILYDYYGASGVIDKIDGYTIDDHVMLIGEDGANLRMRNLPLMYEVKGKAWINNHAHILKPKKDTDFYFLFYCLESMDINPYITGSAQPKLSQENLKNILLPIPPFKEQQQIADYLDKKCAEIDDLIELKEQKIEKLKEYKKSLIYEYVTGKKEVC